MVGALLFASMRWITVKYSGESIPTSSLIFWEPLLVLLVMGAFVDFKALWERLSPVLFSSAILLFLSRQCLVRSYQAPVTSATSISALVYTKLGWTLLFGYWIWGSLPSPLEWFGVLLIIFSSWLVIYQGSASPKED